MAWPWADAKAEILAGRRDDRAWCHEQNPKPGRLNRFRITWGLDVFRRALPASDRRAARQTLWMGATTAVEVLGGLAQVFISVRILGPEGYGVLAVIIAVTSLIHGLLAVPGGDAVTTFGTRGTVQRRPEEASRILRFALAISLGTALIAYALIAALALAAGSLLGIAELGIAGAHVDAVLLYGVVGILMATRTETFAILRLSERVSLGLAITFAATVTRVVLFAVAWITDGGLIAVVLAYVVGAAVYGAGMFIAAAASAPRAGMTGVLRSWSLKVPPDVVRFQYGAYGKSTIGMLTQHIDVILLAQFVGAADVGLYRGARQIVDTARQPFGVLQSGVKPEYSRHWYAGQGAALRRTAFRFTLLAVALAVAGFGVLVAFLEPITGLLLGPGFSGVTPLLLVMIPGSFIAACGSVLVGLLVATGRIWQSLVSVTAGLAAFVAVILWLTPQYGALGTAWGNTALYIMSAIVITPFVFSILKRSKRAVP